MLSGDFTRLDSRMRKWSSQVLLVLARHLFWWSSPTWILFRNERKSDQPLPSSLGLPALRHPQRHRRAWTS